MAGLVPALACHVELQQERGLIAAVADLEVEAGAAGTLERLDLTDEDPVHQPASIVARVAHGWRQPVGLGRRTEVARIEQRLLHGHTEEPLVSGEFGDGQHSLHGQTLATLQRSNERGVTRHIRYRR